MVNVGTQYVAQLYPEARIEPLVPAPIYDQPAHRRIVPLSQMVPDAIDMLDELFPHTMPVVWVFCLQVLICVDSANACMGPLELLHCFM